MNQNSLKEFKTNLAYYFSEVLECPYAKPCWVYISLSHKCIYNCQMCGVVKILNGYELPTEIAKRAFDQIAGWKQDSVIVLTGGEPLLREDIFELIDYAAKAGLKIEVVSNGALIDRNLAYKIISSGLRNIAISIDGAKGLTHDLIRQKGSFQKAISGIDNLVEAKRKIENGPQISVWTTIMKENLGELFGIISLVRDLGVECLVYHPVIVSQDDMQNTSPGAPFWIRGEDLEVLKEQIDIIVDYQAKYGMIAFLHDPYLWIKYFDGSLSRENWKCNPFVFINIGPDGEVRSCGSAFGNIKDMNLDKCLDTEAAFRARRLMKVCQKPCLQTCWAHPESDSLLSAFDNFIENLKNETRRDKLLKEALKILESYENRLRDYKDA
ncbi:radical SAM protein [Patescibacteria group bacterium]|nr:radical SAM protein [Patescibacteria group bacterium]